jgi:serine/threonine protein kinase
VTTHDDLFTTGPPADRQRYGVAAADLEPTNVGGEGLVYRAVERDTGIPIALKLHTTVRLDQFPELSERAAPFAALRHPYLMAHREVFVGPALTRRSPDVTEADVIYSAADWVEGRQLLEVVDTCPVDDTLTTIAHVAVGLAALHRHVTPTAPRGLVHRDVKPSNIRVGPDGSGVLIDFGVARPIDDDLTRGVGTYRWRAPEVLSDTGTVGPASDIWSLGAVAHWACVGEPPGLDGADVARERIRRSARIADLPDPARLARHIAGLLATDPMERPDDLDRWAAELTEIVTGHRGRRFGWYAAGATLFVATAAAVPLVMATGRTPDMAASAAESTTESITALVDTTVPSTGRPGTSGPGSSNPAGTSTSSTIPVVVEPSPIVVQGAMFTVLSPDGTKSAGVTGGKNAEILDIDTGARIAAGRADDPLRPGIQRDPRADWAAFSHDSRWFAYSYPNGLVTVVDAATGALRSAFETYGLPVVLPTTPWADPRVTASPFTADGDSLVLHDTVRGALTIWDIDTGEIVEELLLSSPRNDFGSGSVTWFVSPDGARIARGFAQGSARVWDARTRTERFFDLDDETWDGPPPLSLDADGSTLAVVSPNAVRVFDTTTGAEITPPNDVGGGDAIALSPDGGLALVRSADTGVTVFETATGRTLFEDRRLAIVRRESQLVARFAPNGTTIATLTPDGGIAVIDLAERSTRRLTPRRPVERIGFTGDGTAVFGIADSEVYVWDALSTALRAVLVDGPEAFEIVISPAGSGEIRATRGAFSLGGGQVERWATGS